MKVLAIIGRVALGLVGLVLSYGAIRGVAGVWQADPWAALGPFQTFFGRSLGVSIPAIPLGLVLTAIWPRLWPAPLAALFWTIAATALAEPSRFDFLIEWMLTI